jgi:hypothetical protein
MRSQVSEVIDQSPHGKDDNNDQESMIAVDDADANASDELETAMRSQVSETIDQSPHGEDKNNDQESKIAVDDADVNTSDGSFVLVAQRNKDLVEQSDTAGAEGQTWASVEYQTWRSWTRMPGKTSIGCRAKCRLSKAGGGLADAAGFERSAGADAAGAEGRAWARFEERTIIVERQMMKHMTTQQNEAISQWNDAFQEQLAQSNEDWIKAEKQIAVHRSCCEGLQLQLSMALSDNKGLKSSIKYHEKLLQGHLAHIDELRLRNTTSDKKLRQCQDELKDVRSELGQTESAIKEFDMLKVKFKNCERDLWDVRRRLGDCEATSQDTQNQWDSCDLTLAGKNQIVQKGNDRLDSDIFHTHQCLEEEETNNIQQFLAVIYPPSHGDNDGDDDSDSEESPPPMLENPQPLVSARPDEVLGANNHFPHANGDDVDQCDNEVLADEKTYISLSFWSCYCPSVFCQLSFQPLTAPPAS